MGREDGRILRWRERLAAKMAKTAIMDLDGDGVIDANDVLSIYSTTYSESHNVKNSLLPVIRKVLPAPTPSPQEYYYTRNRLQTPAVRRCRLTSG